MKYEVHYFPNDVATIKDEDSLLLDSFSGGSSFSTGTHAEADAYRKDAIATYEEAHGNQAPTTTG